MTDSDWVDYTLTCAEIVASIDDLDPEGAFLWMLPQGDAAWGACFMTRDGDECIGHGAHPRRALEDLRRRVSIALSFASR